MFSCKKIVFHFALESPFFFLQINPLKIFLYIILLVMFLQLMIITLLIVLIKMSNSMLVFGLSQKFSTIKVCTMDSCFFFLRKIIFY